MGFLEEIADGIVQMFSMFAQLVQYIIGGQGGAIHEMGYDFGNAFNGFGLAIPIVFVMIIGITGGVAYTLILLGGAMNEAMDSADIGGGAGAGGMIDMGIAFIPFSIISNISNIPHSIALDEFSYILNTIGNAIINGLDAIFKAVANGYSSATSGFINGILDAFGLPFKNWSYDIPTNYLVPVIFVLILGISLLILIAWIDSYGIEKDLGEAFADEMEMLNI